MSSRDSRKRHAAKTPLPQEPVKQTQTKTGGTEKLGIAHSPLIPRPPTSGQAVMRPGGRADQATPRTAPRFRSGAGAG